MNKYAPIMAPAAAPAAPDRAPLRILPRAYRTPGGPVYTPFLDLADHPHLLIAGATGSGKSVVVNGLIMSLLMTRSPSRCQFVLLDPKRVELKEFESFPHVLRYAAEPVDMLRALQWTVDEIDRRYRDMQAQGVKEYTGPHLYVIIDELADLLTTQKKEVLPLLQRIAQVGRASLVHIWGCSQCVLASVLSTPLRCNFSTVVGLRTCSTQQSRLLINAPGCEMLPDPKREGKGYAWIRDGADLYKEFVYKYPDDVLSSLRSWWTTSACIAM